MQTTPTTKRPADIAIFGRLIQGGKGHLSKPLARFLLSLGFDDRDQARMGELAEKNQRGELSPEEREELFGYVNAGHLLAILHSKARKALKKKAS